METSKIFISIIVFVMIFAGIFTFINYNFANWGISYENPEIQKILQEIKEQEDKTLSRIQGLSSPKWYERILSAFDTLFGGMWDILKTTFIDTPRIVSALITTFPIPLPGWFISGIMAVLAIVLVSIAVYVIFKVRV